MDDVLKRLGQRRLLQNGGEWNSNNTSTTCSLQLNGSLDSFSQGGYQAPYSLGLKSTTGISSDRQHEDMLDSDAQNTVVCCECGMCSYSGYDEDDVRRHLNRAHGDSDQLSTNSNVRFSPNSDMEAHMEDMIARSKTVGSSSQPMSREPSSSLMNKSIFGQNNSSNMSKLLEQLMQGGGGGEGGVIPVGLSNYADLCSGNQSLFGSSKSPEPGTLTPRSSSAAGETYDLSGMGKKVCALCNTFIANNPSSFDNHACKHLDYKPYYCYYCQYQSYIRGKVTRHIQQVHNGLPVKINHRPVPGIKDKIQTIKMKCFPFLVGGPDCGGPDYSFSSGKVSAGPPSLNETQCKLCEASVLSLESSMDEHLQIHIPVKGSSLNYDGPKYYHCPVCTYQTTYLIRAKQHVHSAHPTSQETRILCCPPDGLKGLQTLRIKCFGASVWSDGLMYEGETLKEESLTEMVDSNDVPLPVSTGEEEEDTSAEQMDTNTTESLGGRLVCGICKALVSNLPATIGSHVRNHLTDYKPYQCSYCIWKSGNEGDVKVHISSTHKNVPLRVLYNPERAELQRMQERCFPRFKGIAFSQEPLVNDSIMANGSISSTLLKKLVCQLCKNTIADNPKSVGIHVKNHLNYKPYRCPFCKYMSCEQSKARRHVEHVHSVSGDTVEIHAEDNIKERITEMKAKCFPSLVSDSTYIADSPEGFQQAIEDTATPPTRYNEDFQIREEWTQEEARYLPVEDRQDNATNPTNNSRDHP